VFVGIGDNQASYLGSVANPVDSVLVNVGTGGQVAMFTERWAWDPLLETRPFPGGGYLLVAAGLCGGASYAVLERFLRQVGVELGGAAGDEPLYPLMNRLAAKAPPGARGLRCEPYFAGTRAQPELRASWSGVSVENFTPGCMARALLEGMARSFHRGYHLMTRHTAQSPRHLVGAGNGLRENPLLAKIVAESFGMPLLFPQHREEAAYGAARLAAVGAKLYPDLVTAGRLMRFGS
jgi:sugar (pentulose or hexulose) kinase